MRQMIKITFVGGEGAPISTEVTLSSPDEMTDLVKRIMQEGIWINQKWFSPYTIKTVEPVRN